MQTSAKGIAELERHEGVVLKAYRCPAGELTIGPGLTKASGVVDPKPGMVITREEATRLLGLALRKNYEPAVAAAMPGAHQHEFDGGISFHYNTGAIGRASWVTSWRRKAWAEVEKRIKLWKKGGGKVLPGLVRRREEEFKLIRYGVYQGAADKAPKRGQARVVLALSAEEIHAAQEGFRKLGYEVGAQGFTRAAIETFQADHDLTVDGIVGRATLSTLQRRLDARRKSGTAATGTAGTGLASGVVEPLPEWLIWAALCLGIAALLWLAFTYRDVVAAKLQRRLPRLAQYLRSI